MTIAYVVVIKRGEDVLRIGVSARNMLSANRKVTKMNYGGEIIDTEIEEKI